ncbi:MAG: ankyrin repeat domain-containing protein [Patescibacteria group bacterium]|jgi:26S proteasome non-ATPase regulatory subunit 10
MAKPVMEKVVHPLLTAVAKDDINSVTDLLAGEGQTDVLVRDEFGCTALHIATFRGNVDLAFLLIDTMTRKDEKSLDLKERAGGQAALHIAAMGNTTAEKKATRLEIARLLLSHGADINLKDNGERTALHIACADGWLEMVQLLCEKREKTADINARERCTSTALGLAEKAGHQEIVDYLKERGGTR